MILRKKDYVEILNFYQVPIPQTKPQMKRQVDSLLAKKFCKCYNKLKPMYQNRAIGACTRSVYNLKRYTRKLRFQCLNERNVNYEPTPKRKSRRIRRQRRQQ